MIGSYAADSQTHMSHCNMSNSDRWEESKHVTLNQHSKEANFRHITYDDNPDCITSNSTSGKMTINTSSSPVIKLAPSKSNMVLMVPMMLQ